VNTDEYHQAELEMQEMICDALERCANGQATEEDLRLLAWQAGVSHWNPTHKEIRV
jgi:uncharacterized protein YbcV (DUF1398 family)